MPAWLLPVLKAIPHIGSILSAAAPVFTQRQASDAANQLQLLQQQILELQTVAANNAAHIKELAAQLQTTVQALQEGASQAELRLQRTLRICIACTIAAVLGSLLAIVLVLQRGG